MIKNNLHQLRSLFANGIPTSGMFYSKVVFSDDKNKRSDQSDTW